MPPMLGLLIGLMLDRSNSPESGHAEIVLDGPDEDADHYRCWWRGPSVWRLDGTRESLFCDGSEVFSWRGSRATGRRKVRPGGEVPYAMQLCFPLRAHIWGRVGDDYAMDSVVPGDSTKLATIRLAGVDDDRSGLIDVDKSSGVLVNAEYGDTQLRLENLQLAPQSDDVFEFRRS
jgi:hypothetical protein